MVKNRFELIIFRNGKISLKHFCVCHRHDRNLLLVIHPPQTFSQFDRKCFELFCQQTETATKRQSENITTVNLG